MTRVVVDRDRCEGHGLCEQTAPQVYRLDDDGELHLTAEELDPADVAPARAGARACPVAALRLDP